MPLIVEQMSGVKSAAVCWLVPAGIAIEPENRQGLTSMWSELLVRGAGNLTSRQHADATDRLGASRSASAGSFAMSISATMLGTRLIETIPLLADMVLRPRFDQDAIEPARDLCLQAIDSLKDDPQERAIIAARLRHLPSPLNRSGYGTPESIKAITRDELVSLWSEWARPGRSIFAAAGAADPYELASCLDSRLEGWSGTTPELVNGPVPPRGYAHEHDETNQVQIVLLHDAPPDTHDDSMLEKIVLSVLSGGMAGRLFTEVREKRGLCYSVNANYRGDKEYGVVTAYVGTTPERASESLKVLRSELERINTPEGRITQEEFHRAVVGLKSSLIFSGESTSARAGALAADQRKLGKPRSLDEIAAKIDSATLDKVNAYLSRRKLGTLTIQTLGPRDIAS